MKVLHIAGLLFILAVSGCSSLKGTVLDGRICQLAAEEDIEAKAQELLDTYPSGATREKIYKKLIYLHAGEATAEMFCLAFRDTEAKVAQ